MFILSQDKTRIFNTSGHIEGIGYKEENFKEGKKEEIRHTIQVFGGCAEEIAEYKCKEDCLLVLYAIFNAIEQGGKTAELPTQEEMKEQREALKQYLESGKKLTEWTALVEAEKFEEGECFLTGHIIKTDGSHDEKRMDDCPIIQRKKKRKAKRR